jgi:F-type H+-transporting ATPase subunit alpha
VAARGDAVRGHQGYLDDVPVEKVLPFETALHAFIRDKHAGWIDSVSKTNDLSKDDESALQGAIETFKKTGAY